MAGRAATKRSTTDLRDARAALYCRVSRDDSERAKSPKDQEAIGRVWVRRVGAQLAERHVYRDNDRSASQYATKQRESFIRLRGAIADDELDVVWFWDQSRQARDTEVFAQLAKLCQRHGVLWAFGDRVLDPDNPADMLSAGIEAVVSQHASEVTRRNVKRGKRSSADEGLPAGRVPYGYRRVYDPISRAWLRDEPDPGDGEAGSAPAAVVREIFERIAAGDSITGIRHDLNDRGIRTRGDKHQPEGYPWDNPKIRYIATNPTYIAQRVWHIDDHYPTAKSGNRSKAVLEGVAAAWPPLVDEELFYKVDRIVNDPKRRTTRMGPRIGRYLLSALACCGECGGKLVRRQMPANNRRTRLVDGYACRDRQCVGVSVEALDRLVETELVAWLSDPATVDDLARARGENSSTDADQARADSERARADLRQLEADLEAGEVSPRAYTIAERRLLGLISDAERRLAELAALPTVLVELVGPQAAAGWAALTLDAKRLVIGTVADIRVRRVGRGYKVPISERVEWDWLIGDGNGHGCQPTLPDSTGDLFADRILAALDDAGPAGLTRTAIRKVLATGVGTARFDAALQVLANTGRAVRTTRAVEGRRGRTAEVWTVTGP
jgi:DNA invertase Pin-like site-specific DNA recombinase